MQNHRSHKSGVFGADERNFPVAGHANSSLRRVIIFSDMSLGNPF